MLILPFNILSPSLPLSHVFPQRWRWSTNFKGPRTLACCLTGEEIRVSTKAEVSRGEWKPPVLLIPSVLLPINTLITSDGLSHCREGISFNCQWRHTESSVGGPGTPGPGLKSHKGHLLHCLSPLFALLSLCNHGWECWPKPVAKS